MIRPQNLPVEILRTIVAIAEARTYSKAAARLGISQPAVSAQIKRLQQIVGGEIFRRDVGGSTPTKLGETVISLARKVLEAHDQILRLTANDGGAERIRLGISSLLVREFMFAQLSSSSLAHVFVQSDSSYVLARGLIDGRLDIACCFAMGGLAPELESFVVAEREADLVWVRASNFVLSPGQPIPIVTWYGDEWITSALTRHGLAYRIVFDGQDYEAKRAVVEAGQGLIALPARCIPASLVRAREYYLPPLPQIKTTLYVRGSEQSPRMTALINQLRQLFFEQDMERPSKDGDLERF